MTKQNNYRSGVRMLIISTILIVIGVSVLNASLWILEWIYNIKGWNLNLPGVGHEVWISFLGSVFGGVVGVGGVYLTLTISKRKDLKDESVKQLDDFISIHTENLKIFQLAKYKVMYSEIQSINENLDITINKIQSRLEDMKAEMQIAEFRTILMMNDVNNIQARDLYIEAIQQIQNTALRAMIEIEKLCIDKYKLASLDRSIKKIEKSKVEGGYSTDTSIKSTKEKGELEIEKIEIIGKKPVDWREFNIEVYSEALRVAGKAIVENQKKEIEKYS